MKISAVDIRPGNILEYEGGLWRAVKIQHTQPGKGGAYMQVELKNLIDGRKNNNRFRSAETVEKVRLDTKDFQYLFADGDMLVFMDKENYEQIACSPTCSVMRRRSCRTAWTSCWSFMMSARFRCSCPIRSKR